MYSVAVTMDMKKPTVDVYDQSMLSPQGKRGEIGEPGPDGISGFPGLQVSTSPRHQAALFV